MAGRYLDEYERSRADRCTRAIGGHSVGLSGAGGGYFSHAGLVESYYGY